MKTGINFVIYSLFELALKMRLNAALLDEFRGDRDDWKDVARELRGESIVVDNWIKELEAERDLQ